MRKRPTRTRRWQWGLGAIIVASFAASGAVSTSAQTPEQSPAPTQEADPTDTQSGSPDARPDFVGDYATAGLGAAAAGPDDPDGKAEDLGPVGQPSASAQDVPGASDASADDAADTQYTLPATGRVGDSDDALRAAVANGKTARVIVMTRLQTASEAEMSASEVDAQRAQIAQSLDSLAGSLAGSDAALVHELDVIPSAVYTVGESGLEALLANPDVASIVTDKQVQATLDVSTGIIDSDLLNAAGVLGDGFNGSPVNRYDVAILDSGVDNANGPGDGHDAFVGRIVSEACYSLGLDGTANGVGNCPNGGEVQTTAGAGDNCTHSTDCDHGTHVGGIAAGGFYTNGHEGVARGAGIVAINVASDSGGPRWTAFFSDINLAMQRVLTLKAGARPDIVAINMSIGTAATFPDGAACDNVSPSTTNLMQSLRNVGIAPVVAAGNSFDDDQMSYPGCASTALAIGATNDADVPAGFSNSSPGLEWWAPGVGIVAPVPTDTNKGSKDGTSMAAPHVAGAFTALSECVDGNGVPLTLGAKISRFNATGVNVTRNGVTRKRINLLDAATGTVNNNDFAFPETLPAAGNFNDFDFTVCSDAEPGEPGPFSIDNGIWWRWTPNATGVVTIDTNDGGGNVTTFDTTLAVYTGNTLGSLQVRAFDDDSGVGLRSLVTMGVNAGTTYRIKVDGFAAANGLLNLHVSPITPALCQGVAATLVGGPLNDVINGTNGNDVIVGFAGNDTINGNGGNDRICGDAGDDTINAGDGGDVVFGGPGADNIHGGSGADVLLGNAGGGDVNDVGDVINGGFGNDTLDGWVGNDVLIGGPGNDLLLGAAGIDTASYAGANSPVNANLTTNTATGLGTDTFSGIENLRGGNRNDSLMGNAGVNRLNGGPGNDWLNGRGGNDVLDGDGGRDTAGFLGSPAAVNANLTTGTATGDGNDTLVEIENLGGSQHNDVLRGNAGRNWINGGGGADAIFGLGNHDTLLGGAGADSVRGGFGNDLLRGGDQNDVLFGEAGNDRLFGEFGNDHHNGGPGFDRCDGGPGFGDTRVFCEVFSNIP
jgi:Ca2+-binding RTX toxin-like protein